MSPNPVVAGERDVKAADAWFRKARREASQDNYATALRHLQRAYAADPLPKYVANQGVAYLKMKQYAEAVERFEWFLERVDAPDDRALAESYLLKLKPQVIVTSEPPGARVLVDARELGVTPLITEVVAGEHLLQVALEGHLPTSRPLIIELNEGQSLHVELAVDPLAALEEKTLEPPRPPAETEPAPLPVVEPGWGASEWGWTAIVVGGVAAATAGTLGALAFGALDARDEAGTRPQWQARQADAEAYGIGMYATGGTAIVAVSLGVILLAAHEPPSGVRIGPGGVGVEGRF